MEAEGIEDDELEYRLLNKLYWSITIKLINHKNHPNNFADPFSTIQLKPKSAIPIDIN